MNDSSKTNYMTIILTGLLTVPVTLLVIYFTDIFYKPEVLYTVSGSKISLPEEYEMEIAKVRAVLMMKNFQKVMSQKNMVSKKSLTVEAGIREKGIGAINNKSAFYTGVTDKIGNNSVTGEGADFEGLIENMTAPDSLRALLEPQTTFPTAFSIIEIYNAGNREANDLEMSILPNGVLVDSTIESTESSAENWEPITDKQVLLPIGLHLPPIKRLPAGGKIKLKIYWNVLDTKGNTSGETTPTVEVKGSYSGGMIQFVDSKIASSTNWLLLSVVGILLFAGGITTGYWIRRYRTIKVTH